MGETRFIVAGNLIDGSGSGVQRQAFLAVKDGLITAVGAVKDLPSAKGAVIDDLSHCTIVPALVDCSVLLGRSPAVDPRMLTTSSTTEPHLVERHIRYCHAHGVLGVADSSGPVGLVRQRASACAEGGLVGLRTSGPIVMGGEECAACDDADRDFIKIGASPDIAGEEAILPRMHPDTVRQVLLRYRGGKRVVVANGPQAVAEALAAGCDAIEQGYRMGEDNLKAMAERQVLWIPNLLRAKNGVDGSASGGEVCCRFSLRYVAPGKPIPGAEAYWKSMLAGQLAQLRLARALGVPTAIGTGAGGMGILHGESMAEEMKLFIKAGYSLEEAIHCGSEQGARFFAMRELGALTTGCHATFLVTLGTPQQLPRKLSFLENIYINGIPSSGYRKNPVQVVYEK
jgi:imidazolonepropionase-like amidohydrolase